MICKECGIENNDSAKFCKACGAKLEMPQPEPAPAPEPANVFCQQCGTENSPTAAFCKNCGSPMAKNESAPQASAFNPGHAQARIETAFQGAASTMGNAKKNIGPKIMDLLKMTFTSPVKYFEKARENSDYWLVSLFAIIISCIVLSLTMVSMIDKMVDGMINVEFSDLMSPVELFFRLLAMLVICLGISAPLMFGIGKLFGSEGEFKNVLGSLGPSYLVIFIALFISVFFVSAETESTVNTGYGIMAIFLALAFILAGKANDVITGLKDAKSVYSLLCFIFIYALAVYFIYQYGLDSLKEALEDGARDLMRNY